MGAQAYYRSRRRIDKAVSAMVKGKKNNKKNKGLRMVAFARGGR